jgi:hypothetical protein
MHLIDIPLKAPLNKSLTLHSKIVFLKKNKSDFRYRKKIVARKRKLILLATRVSTSVTKYISSFEKVYQIKI